MEELKKKLTIITPTYNRAYILNNCYISLINQTSCDFYWWIIDDGSTDETKELVNKWIEKGRLEIKYFKKPNGGKASALNLAFDKLDSEYWVCLDSDDVFDAQAVEKAIKELIDIQFDDRYCGLLALRNTINGDILGGKRIPKHIMDATVLEIVDKFKIRSEFIQFYKTVVTKNYRFPIVQNEKFIPPEYLSVELGKQYKFKISQETYCYCEYLPDGLTSKKVEVIKNNPRGYTLVVLQAFTLTEKFSKKILRCIKYISGCILSRDEDCLKNSPHKVLTITCYPLGFIVYMLRFKLSDRCMK